ncbi:iron-hydroxamate ABC transporter substrate-binding protein [Bacillus sp. 28A-2]|uniref:iron-hydroxamate ABC transporter substrate-binding protein n=1 Tax=Bacillus sp. 28A-2 TaxID=2772252 RepID=UPI00168D4BD3|nr:iron-hydroxamate ABC transporter substrate-binding protein [Bacillus sp. 28A-2]MBD3860267.1 iron-hydroxamate ABC transporter substrate-binding protein [Bacillus sp. 28A-2]
MKKILFPLMLIFVLALSACGNNSNSSSNKGNQSTSSDTITYQSENGPVKLPAHPKRVVVLGSYTGNVMSLGVNLVGVDSWSKKNPRFQKKLKNVEEVSDENVEKIMKLKPDVIIGLSNAKNVEKLKKIAPTVLFTYNKVDYLQQHIEIGKVLNKEKEAKAWVKDFKERAAEAGKEIKAKIGEDATVSVFESGTKDLYVFGDAWGRGTEILYQAMKLKMPEKVKEKALKAGYYAVSQEVIPEFAGDYMIISKNSEMDNSYQNSDIYKSIPAVKKHRVYEASAEEFYFNDPLTLEYQLSFFKKHFLGK